MTVLLYGDTVRNPALRHEVPLAIVDPFLFVERDGRPLVLTSSLEASRIAAVLPGAEVLVFDQLGFFELLEEGTIGLDMHEAPWLGSAPTKRSLPATSSRSSRASRAWSASAGCGSRISC